MKLLCVNLGLFLKNNEKISKFLKENPSDILVLQEVTRGLSKDVNPDFITYDLVMENSGHDYSYLAPKVVIEDFEAGNFHGDKKFYCDFEGWLEFCLQTTSKHEIYFGKNVYVQNEMSYVTDWSTWPEEDYRSVQVTDIKIEDDKMIRILNIHGIWSKNKAGNEITDKSMEIARDLALEVNFPSIIAGDFNLFPDTNSIGILNKEFRNLMDEYEIRTTRPDDNELSSEERNVVDYIFVSDGIKVNDMKVIESDVTDHLPLSLDFDIN